MREDAATIHQFTEPRPRQEPSRRAPAAELAIAAVMVILGSSCSAARPEALEFAMGRCDAALPIARALMSSPGCRLTLEPDPGSDALLGALRACRCDGTSIPALETLAISFNQIDGGRLHSVPLTHAAPAGDARLAPDADLVFYLDALEALPEAERRRARLVLE